MHENDPHPGGSGGSSFYPKIHVRNLGSPTGGTLSWPDLGKIRNHSCRSRSLSAAPGFVCGVPPWSVEDEAASAEDGGEAGFQRIGEFAEFGEDEGFFAARGDFRAAVAGAGEKRIKLDPAFHGLLARRGRFPARAGSAGRADILPASTARIPRAAGPRNGGDRAGVSKPDRSGRRA